MASIKNSHITIGIDCRLAGLDHAGIGRYIQEVVMRLTQDVSVQWVLFVAPKHPFSFQKNQHIRIVTVDIQHYSLKEQLLFPLVLIRERLDIFYVPHYNVPFFYPRKFVVTIHDLLWHEKKDARATTLPPFLYWIKHIFYQIVVSAAVHRSSALLVPSVVTKNQVLHFFPQVHSGKISVIPEGVSESFLGKFSKSQRAHATQLVYTGSLYPHKNVSFIVECLKNIPDFTLLISSARTVFLKDFMNTIQRENMSQRVRYLGRLSDEELSREYEKSFALVQPSFFEGFGLTGIEAMASGLPVLASRLSIFDEVYGEAYVSFDPKDVSSFLHAIQILKKNWGQYQEKGYRQARRYSWENTSNKIRAVMQKVATQT